MSDEKAMLCYQSLIRMEQKSLTDGGPGCRQLFKLGDSLDDVKLQSNTMRMEVVDDSFHTG